MMQDAPPKVVMVQDEPRHHQVFHQGPVRILDVQIPSGEVTLFHTHDTAILYVPIALSPTDTQVLGQDWLGVKPTARSRFEDLVVASDTSYATRALTHRVKNVGSGLFRLIAITNATNPAGAARSSPPGRSLLTSHWYHATELIPSGTSDWHTAGAPTVIVQPATGETRIEVGGEVRLLKGPGEWAYVEQGMKYRVSGMSKGSPSRVVVVQANQ